jgi:hypothetical protein
VQVVVAIDDVAVDLPLLGNHVQSHPITIDQTQSHPITIDQTQSHPITIDQTQSQSIMSNHKERERERPCRWWWQLMMSSWTSRFWTITSNHVQSQSITPNHVQSQRETEAVQVVVAIDDVALLQLLDNHVQSHFQSRSITIHHTRSQSITPNHNQSHPITKRERERPCRWWWQLMMPRPPASGQSRPITYNHI